MTQGFGADDELFVSIRYQTVYHLHRNLVSFHDVFVCIDCHDDAFSPVTFVVYMTLNISSKLLRSWEFTEEGSDIASTNDA